MLDAMVEADMFVAFKRLGVRNMGYVQVDKCTGIGGRWARFAVLFYDFGMLWI